MTATTPPTADTALRALELICSGDTGPAVEEVIHPDSVNHPQGRTRGGPDGFRDVVRWLTAAFAEISITPHEVITSGDKVVARTRFKALHVGPFHGIPPTNRTIEFEQIQVWRLQDGLIAEHWACMDEVTALRQMGVVLPSRAEGVPESRSRRPMAARLSMYENVDLDLADQVQQWMEASETDPFGELPGYRGSMTLVDRDNARLVGIGFYASAGQAREADALLPALFEQALDRVPAAIAPALDMRPNSVGLYEIVHRD